MRIPVLNSAFPFARAPSRREAGDTMILGGPGPSLDLGDTMTIPGWHGPAKPGRDSATGRNPLTIHGRSRRGEHTPHYRALGASSRNNS